MLVDPSVTRIGPGRAAEVIGHVGKGFDGQAEAAEFVLQLADVLAPFADEWRDHVLRRVDGRGHVAGEVDGALHAHPLSNGVGELGLGRLRIGDSWPCGPPTGTTAIS